MEKGIIVHTAIINRDKILILKRIVDTYLGNRWDLPGGTLEDGEDPKEGAIREAFEETGLRIDAIKLFFHYSNIDQDKDKQFITLIFLCEIKSTLDTILINPEEHSGFEWVRLDSIADYETVDYLPPCVETIKNYSLLEEKPSSDAPYVPIRICVKAKRLSLIFLFGIIHYAFRRDADLSRLCKKKNFI